MRWATILLGRFFMRRMGGFLGANSKSNPPDRRPIHMDDVDPMYQGNPTHWGEHVGEMCVHISGSKSDWLNQGCVRSHTKVCGNSPNADICVAMAFASLFAEAPAKFRRNRDVPVAVWMYATPIQPSVVTSFLRVAVGKGAIALRDIPCTL